MDRETLIGRIYEAASIPELWPEVLEEFGSIVDTPRALVAIRRSDGWLGHSLSPAISAATTEYFQSDVPTRTEIAARLIAANHAGFVRSDDVFTPAEWERDPFRHEWARKWGFNHGIATAIQTLSEETLVIHLQRLEGEASFASHEVSLLDSFRPHLARAGLLAARLRLERMRAATDALAAIGLPAAILDGRGKVLAANSLIEQLTTHIKWLSADRLSLVDRKAAGLLKDACAQLSAAMPIMTGSFVSRPTERHVAVCHVIPTAGQARDLFDGGTAVLVVSPLATRTTPSADVIQSLFDLTPAEAVVAQWISKGRSIADLAAARRTSVNTVRTQVRSVLSKMGATRQAQVAALLAGVGSLSKR
jgi:DNA-binding CsgD family transcriptional regulator